MTDPVSGAASAAIPVVLRAGDDSSPWVEWHLTLGADGISFTRAHELVEILDSEMSGLSWHETVLTLHATSGSGISVRNGAALADVAALLSERICSLRESTRPLRAFGSRRGNPGADHDRFFEPFIAARRVAESAKGPEQRLAAFDAARIEAAVDQVLHSFAAERFSKSPPDRRALNETLLSEMEPLKKALAGVQRAMQAADSAVDSQRFTRWREWLDAVDNMFFAADRCWLQILPLLGETPHERESLWRRLWRSGRGRG
jgi:hypothetical protein